MPIGNTQGTGHRTQTYLFQAELPEKLTAAGTRGHLWKLGLLMDEPMAGYFREKVFLLLLLCFHGCPLQRECRIEKLEAPFGAQGEVLKSSD